jgi:hypothetical protein
MARRSFKRFLISFNAIQAHVLSLTLIVLLSVSLWNGEAQPDYKWGLLFCIVAYPVVIGLLWWSERLDEQLAVEHVIESLTAPEKLRRKRRWWRRGSLALMVGVAAWLIYDGRRGLLINSLPAQYVGYFLAVLATCGAAGLNVWYGGPLDPRFDPPLEDENSSLGDA